MSNKRELSASSTEVKTPALQNSLLSCLLLVTGQQHSHANTKTRNLLPCFNLTAYLQVLAIFPTLCNFCHHPVQALSLYLDNCKLVFLFLSLIPLLHSSRGHQRYLSKHLFVSNQPLASKIWWLPISCRSEVQISWPGLKSPSPSGCSLSCLFWLFLCYTPHAHISTQVHILHIGTGMMHMPQSRRDTPIHTLLCSDCT